MTASLLTWFRSRCLQRSVCYACALRGTGGRVPGCLHSFQAGLSLHCCQPQLLHRCLFKIAHTFVAQVLPEMPRGSKLIITDLVWANFSMLHFSMRGVSCCVRRRLPGWGMSEHAFHHLGHPCKHMTNLRWAATPAWRTSMQKHVEWSSECRCEFCQMIHRLLCACCGLHSRRKKSCSS